MGVREFARSSVGGKTVMAVSGIGLCGFILIHMLGNWLVFAGPNVLNNYAANLKANSLLLWGARTGLLFCFGVHIFVGIRLAAANRVARPIPYGYPSTIQANAASRTMIHTGLLVLAFLFFHLAHFTFHFFNSADVIEDAKYRVDVFRMVVLGFQNPLIASSYIVAMLLLGAHLSHGFSSLFQSLGLSHGRCQKSFRLMAIGFSLLITIGNISMPIAVLTGVIHLQAGGR